MRLSSPSLLNLLTAKNSPACSFPSSLYHSTFSATEVSPQLPLERPELLAGAEQGYFCPQDPQDYSSCSYWRDMLVIALPAPFLTVDTRL